MRKNGACGDPNGNNRNPDFPDFAKKINGNTISPHPCARLLRTCSSERSRLGQREGTTQRGKNATAAHVRALLTPQQNAFRVWLPCYERKGGVGRERAGKCTGTTRAVRRLTGGSSSRSHRTLARAWRGHDAGVARAITTLLCNTDYAKPGI
eukprot:gene13093-biopygen21537